MAACLLLIASVGCGRTAEPREPTVDIRFRGVGFDQVPVFGVGATGGPMPGLGAESVEWAGTGFMAWGIVNSDIMSIHGTQILGDDSTRHVRQWWNGLDCPTSLAAALASNSVVLGIGGDPDASNSTCTLFGVGPEDADPVTYEYLVGSAQSAAEIEALLGASENARSFVLTAITQVGDDRYSFVAESIGQTDGRYEQFETVVRRAALSDLLGVAEALASSGYIITASSWEGGPQYTLVGTRESSGARARAVRVSVSDAARFTGDVAQLVAEGYSPVSVTLGRSGDDVLIYLIGQR